MIVTAVNNNPLYKEQLLALLASLRTNAPNEDIHAYLVNCDKSFAQQVVRTNPRVVVRNRSIAITEDPEVIRGTMVCFRATAILETLQIVDEPVAWFDADVLVRNSLEQFWRGVHDKALKIVCRPDTTEHKYFQAGVFALGNSPETIELVRDWKAVIENLNYWYADQLWLFKLTQKSQHKIELINLASQFNDQLFQSSSTIWHSKNSHFESIDFQNEYQHYLRQANN